MSLYGAQEAPETARQKLAPLFLRSQFIFRSAAALRNTWLLTRVLH